MESNRQEELEGMDDFSLNEVICKIYGYASDKWVVSTQTKIKCDACVAGPMIYMDWCNNPEDIMPLAIENGISLEYLPCTEEWCAQEAKELTNRAFNINPYRAICIVLILMKEAENA